MTQYSNLVNKNGTIYNIQTGQGYSTPAQLAADLGISPASIQWNQIQRNDNYQPAQTNTSSNSSATNVNLHNPNVPPDPNMNWNPRTNTWEYPINNPPVPNISTSTPTSTPTPTTTGSSTPAPEATNTLPDKYKTGNSSIDAVLGQMYSYIQNNIASGKQLNPDLTINNNTIQQFINQAHAEIDPYYASQLGAIKDDLIANLTDTAKAYEDTAKQEALKFKQSISASQESAAGAGLAFSGSRALGEQQATEAEQSTLNLDQIRAASDAAAKARTAESQIGTAGVSGISMPSLPSYSALVDSSGGSVVAGGTQSYFTPGGGSAGTVMGTLPAQQATDIAKRVSGLKSDLLTQRSYGSLTTPTTA